MKNYVLAYFYFIINVLGSLYQYLVRKDPFDKYVSILYSHVLNTSALACAIIVHIYIMIGICIEECVYMHFVLRRFTQSTWAENLCPEGVFNLKENKV